MTYVYDESAFVIDKTVEHEECPECKGGTLNPLKMTTVYEQVLTSSDTYENKPFFQDSPPMPDHLAHLPHGYSCSRKDCYFGKILTPYERRMQKIVYDLTGKSYVARNKIADLEATIKKFMDATLVERFATALRGNLPHFRVVNLPGHDPIIRRSQD